MSCGLDPQSNNGNIVSICEILGLSPVNQLIVSRLIRFKFCVYYFKIVFQPEA